MHVYWSVQLQTLEGIDGGTVLRIVANLTASNDAYPRSLALLALRSGNPADASCGQTLSTGSVPGSPVLLDNHFFAAVEHPLGLHDLNKTSSTDLLGHVNHLASMDWKNRPFVLGAVVGAFAETIQARRAFNKYLSQARPRSWQGPLVHYNSWYDFTSWQDQSFFDPRRAATLHQSLWLRQLLDELSQDQMNETSAIQKITLFHDELVVKRKVQIDSFLWDDGWDDPHRGMWAFNVDRFPNGFVNLARTAASLNCLLTAVVSQWLRSPLEHQSLPFGATTPKVATAFGSRPGAAMVGQRTCAWPRPSARAWKSTSSRASIETVRLT